jgi:hypothetical protein
MSVSQERFESLVQAAAANHHKIVNVAVAGFGFVLTLASRRYEYDLRVVYDPATDSWTGLDPYRGGTLPAIINEIARMMKE